MNNLDIVNKANDCIKCGNVNMFEMQSFFSTRVAPIWNSLPSSVVLETSVNRFKSSLSKISSEKKLFCDYD